MDEFNTTQPPEENPGEMIPVKVRSTVQMAAQKEREYAEFQARYAGEKPKNDWKRKSFWLPPQHRRPIRPAPENLTEDEKRWAAIAHGSALVTVAIGFATGGVGALITLFVPLMIYFYFRQKSEYVARHALQAFAAQVVGIVGFVLLVTVMFTAWILLIIISAILILLLVGILLLPLVIFGGLIALGATFILPLAMLVYGMIAAVESLNGNNYSYPWIGDWVDDQLYGSMRSM